MKTLADVAKEIASLFDRLNCPYAIMGGLAVRAYAMPRATYDVDFAVTIPRERLEEFFNGVEELGYTVPEAYRGGWVDYVGDMPLVKARLYLGDRGIDADIFLAENPHQQETMQRRRLDRVENQELWLVSPEDLLILKLAANRQRDLADVLDILFTLGELDWSYIESWAIKLGILDRWKNAESGVVRASTFMPWPARKVLILRTFLRGF